MLQHPNLALATLQLSRNIAFLFALIFVYNQILPQIKHLRENLQALVTGCLFGLFTLLMMLTPIAIALGVYADGRTVIIVTAGIFGGWKVAVIVCAIVVPFQFVIGDLSVAQPIGLTLTSAGLGVLVHMRWRERLYESNVRALLVGIFSGIVWWVWMAVTPSHRALMTNPMVILPVLLVYPIGILLLGKSLTLESYRHKSEAHLSGILDLAHEAIISIDGQQRILLFNRGAEHIFGYQPEEVIGQPVEMLLPERFRRLHSNHIAGFGAATDVARLMNVRGQIYGLRKNGDEFPAEASISKLELRGEQFFTVVLRDITERRRTEDALRESETRLSGILDLAPEAIISIGEDQRILLFNRGAEHIFGYKSEEMMRQPVEVLLPERFRRSHSHHIDGFSSGAEVARLMNSRGQIYGLRKNGEEFPAEASISKLELPGATFFTVVLRDITERKRAEELKQFAAGLERSNRELQDFAQVASHDLQEPLRKIQAFGDQLRTRAGDNLDEKAQDYLQRMQNAAQRMQTLITDLLAFSRLTTRVQPFQDVDLSQLVKEVLADLEIRIRESGAQVEVGTLMTIDAEPTQMRQLVQNLLSNALKFRKPDTTPIVKVSGQQGGSGMYRLTVEDNGIGFDPKYAERIFGVFQRLHSKGEYEGTGIGLAVCRKIVERHGGTITTRSTPGEGAAFIVTLPIQQPQFTKEVNSWTAPVDPSRF